MSCHESVKRLSVRSLGGSETKPLLAVPRPRPLVTALLGRRLETLMSENYSSLAAAGFKFIVQASTENNSECVFLAELPALFDSASEIVSSCARRRR